jgi:uncharacterized protein (DUF4415 family)
MKPQYDFSKGKRGRIAPLDPEPKGPSREKTRITIRLDEDLIDHFLKQADATGGAIGYQAPLHLTSNEALRQHVEGKAPQFEETLRRILREEIKAAN